MSAAIATLPRAGGNGAALVTVVADLVINLFAKAPAKAAPKAKAVTKAASIPAAAGVDIWQLYRLGVSSDSVSPNVLAKLRGNTAE